jgi:dipeptidyl aminopeptidase/acylaminoacyl peptidase
MPLKQVTHLNDGAKPPVRTESIEWTNQGFHVQGWLTYPVNYDPAKKYPLIVSVHGGPSASASARWGGNVWSELGYFTFAPNPRGSFGQGEKFTAANIKDFGYGDLRDILAGMDAVEAKVSIDKSREGLTGWSYGGFMTMFAVTQTHRFKAAVAGAGISDWKSYYGENSIDQWMVPFFGHTVYDDPAVYAKSSAIDFIKNVTTPTLVVVGDRDGECPAPQSFEFWHALRAEGIKTQLVVFPNEGHGFRNPAHIRDLEAREVAWFAKYMPAS